MPPGSNPCPPSVRQNPSSQPSMEKESNVTKDVQQSEVDGTDNTEGLIEGTTTESNEVDINLNDPDVEKAAVSIQAGFRGMQVRKEARTSNQPVQEEVPEVSSSSESSSEQSKITYKHSS